MSRFLHAFGRVLVFGVFALAACGLPDDSAFCIPGAPCGPVPQYDESTPAPVQTTTRFQSIGLGNWHSCMLDTGGAAWCWGSNQYGQLGAPTTALCDGDIVACSAQPLRVDGGHVFVSLVASERHTCGLAADGQAWCWGFGQGGQLGDGTRTDSQLPRAVAGGHRFVLIAASLWEGVTCGMESDHSVWCWGVGLLGSIGPALSSTPASWAPANAVALRSLGLGESHACGLDTGGQAWCWGSNAYGQLGNGSSAFSSTPQRVAGARPYTQLAVGPLHNCALEATGQAWCWGMHASGDGGSADAIHATPVAVAGGHTFVRIAAGQQSTCGIDAVGSAWCWGKGMGGALGDGSTADNASPAAVAGGLLFADIGSGGMATCGIVRDGTAYCWGWNSVGALGKPIVPH